MKIVHISTSVEGGAGLCTLRIHKGLLKQGIDSTILCLYKTDEIENIVFFKNKKRSFFMKILKVLGYKNKYDKHKTAINKLKKQNPTIFYSTPFSEHNIADNQILKDADVIHIHWVAFFLNIPLFFLKHFKAKIIWTIYDENIFMGGFHYRHTKDMHYKAYKKIEDESVEIKMKILKKRKDIIYLSLSEDMLNMSKNNTLLKDNTHKLIHVGVDTMIFTPKNKTFACKVFNIDKDVTTLLFVARINEERKGYKVLIQALNELALKNICLILVGPGIIENENLNIKRLGTINDDRLLSLAYSASDLFITPSFQETFGQTTIEAMACGVPVISFPNAGAKDIINDDNGILTNDFTVEALKNAILKGLIKKWDSNIIINSIKEKFTSEIMTNNYIKLYSDIYSTSQIDNY